MRCGIFNAHVKIDERLIKSFYTQMIFLVICVVVPSIYLLG
jgi:hypothetical protein